MICFGAKTDQKVKEKGDISVSLLKKIKNKNHKRAKDGQRGEI